MAPSIKPTISFRKIKTYNANLNGKFGNVYSIIVINAFKIFLDQNRLVNGAVHESRTAYQIFYKLLLRLHNDKKYNYESCIRFVQKIDLSSEIPKKSTRKEIRRRVSIPADLRLPGSGCPPERDLSTSAYDLMVRENRKFLQIKKIVILPNGID